jgi:hypothetical protein
MEYPGRCRPGNRYTTRSGSGSTAEITSPIDAPPEKTGPFAYRSRIYVGTLSAWPHVQQPRRGFRNSKPRKENPSLSVVMRLFCGFTTRRTVANSLVLGFPGRPFNTLASASLVTHLVSPHLVSREISSARPSSLPGFNWRAVPLDGIMLHPCDEAAPWNGISRGRWSC